MGMYYKLFIVLNCNENTFIFEWANLRLKVTLIKTSSICIIRPSIFYTTQIFYSMFFCFVSTDRFKHTILPSSNLWSSSRNRVLRQVQRRLTILQPHEILHGQYSLPHLYAVNGPSSCLYVLNTYFILYKIQ